MKHLIRILFASTVTMTAFLSFAVAAETTKAPAKKTSKVKYKSQKDVNFEELLIQGQLKRPDLFVITGDVKQGGDGLIRLRKDFVDRIATDFGEEIK